ncbi:MAG TPA: bacillithiol biosynthesis cysteine-adding enzyme BshC [Flavisolibacter sp.]
MFAAEAVPYRDTNAFSAIVSDYVEGKASLQPFYSAAPTVDGVRETIVRKENQALHREVLVAALREQYQQIEVHKNVGDNIEALRTDTTFTVCTAHQPNLFTGPLYFIYKIIHAVKLADTLSRELPGYRFVPVYYMGSEDADLEELNHTFVQGKKYQWDTDQKGAVGRMLADRRLIGLIDELDSHIGRSPHGAQLVHLFRESYMEGSSIQDATFKIVNALFESYGLVVLIPDTPLLKGLMKPLFEEELFRGRSSEIVAATSGQLGKNYGVQAHPRAINLFYLKDNIRERIEKDGEVFKVVNTALSFTEKSLRQELSDHPERFSPNVILRGLYQETILPNIAFIGGGGELAYWLQLKDLFAHYSVVFPVLVLRNSFLLLARKNKVRQEKLGLTAGQLFLPEYDLLNLLIEQDGSKPVLNGQLDALEEFYAKVKHVASASDPTLQQHVESLKTRSIKDLRELERKMLRAERRKRVEEGAAVQSLKSSLFPGGNLQERTENIAQFWAAWGPGFIQQLHQHSLSLEQQFVVLTETSKG